MTERADDARELDLLMERSGIAVPADWRPGVLAGYRALRGMTDLLRQPREADSEPANVYDISTINRGS